MIIIGILSIIQAIFLPGFIIIAFLNLHKSIIRCVILSAILSPIVNFFIVYILTSLHLYTTPFIYTLIIIELCLLLFLFFRKQTPYEFFPQTAYDGSFYKKYHFSKNITMIHLTIFLLMFVTLVYFVNHFTFSAITPFHTRDALISFHKWAVDWFNNILPTKTYDYPQLLSANWSIFYLVIGTPIIQNFAHAYTALFPLLILLIIFDLALRKKQLAYLIGFIATGYLIIKCNAITGNLNSADVPCAFFSTASFYFLLIAASLKEPKQINQLIFFGAISAAGAALTKQAGLYVAILYPLMAYMITLKNSKFIRTPLPTILKCYAIILILVLPWYLYKEIQILLNRAYTSYDSLLIHQLQHSYLQRPIFFYTYLMPMLLGKIFPLIILPITLIFGIITNKLYRQLFFIFILPFFIIWLFFFSYDCRNLAIVIPLIGIIMGFGIEAIIRLAQKALQLDKRITKKHAHFLIALLSIAIFVSTISFQYNSKKLLLLQTELEVNVGLPKLNKLVYAYLMKRNFRPKILTNAFYLKYLPKLTNNIIFENFTNMNTFEKHLNSNKPDLIAIIKLLLVQQLLSKKDVNILTVTQKNSYYSHLIKNYIAKRVLANLPKHHKILIDTKDYMLIHVNWKK